MIGSSTVPQLPSLLYGAWLVALTATLGALFVGEVMGQAPCVLCWYQRVAMFPLPILLGVAAWRSDAGIWHYALPLSLTGLAVATWHSLLYVGVLPAVIEPCGLGLSCTDTNMALWGAIPLPILSAIAFAAISLLLTLVARASR